MSYFDLIVSGGEVVHPDGDPVRQDVAITNGKIAALLPPRSEAPAREIMNAAGRTIFPGLIDAHVHFGFGEPITEYTTETIYAAQGGFSTIIGYFLNNEPYGDVFTRELDYAEPRAFVDFAFHFSTASERHIEEMDRYVTDYGVNSFKYFMNFRGEEGRYLGLDGTDDGYLYKLLQTAAALDDVTIVLHTENIEVVNLFRRAAIISGRTPDLKMWGAVKPAFTEAESCIRAMFFAEHLGAKIYIPHISTRMALDEVRKWRSRYSNIFVETCPHYLTHTEESDLGSLGRANPPFRTQDDVDAMWEGLADGSIDVVASDHVPRKKATKEKPFWQASQGFPGTATILPVLLDQGYHKGKISLGRICSLLTANPARIFGLPQKGGLEIGWDADLTLVDLNFERQVKASEFGSYADYSLYEGFTFRGWPMDLLLRGENVMRNGQIVGAPGAGHYIKRGASYGK